VPVTYIVDHRRQRILATGSGAVTIAELTAYIAARVRDGVYDYDQLLDLANAELDVRVNEVLHDVKQARTHLGTKAIPLTAIVARQGTATFGLARQLATLFNFEGSSIQVCTSIEDAQEWMDKERAERRNNEPAADDSRS
jgi:hypothetical protein